MGMEHVLSEWSGVVEGSATATLGVQQAAMVTLVASQEGSGPMELTSFLPVWPIPSLRFQPGVRAITSRDARWTTAAGPWVAFYSPREPVISCEPEWRPERRVIQVDSADLERLRATPAERLQLFNARFGLVDAETGGSDSMEAPSAPVRRGFTLRKANEQRLRAFVALWGREEVPIAHSDREGIVWIEAPPGSWNLRLIGSNGESGSWTGDVGPTESGSIVEVRDSADVDLDVEFRDEFGKRVAAVRAWRLGEPFLGGAATPSGSIRFRRLRAGETLTVCAATGSDAIESFEVTIPEGVRTHSIVATLHTTPRVRRVENGWIAGLLVAEEDGEAIASAQILAFPTTQESEITKALAGREPRVAPVASAVSDESGRFRLGPVRAQEELSLVVRRKGRAPAIAGPVSLPQGVQEADLGVVQVPKGRTLRGRVLDPEGRGVAAAVVSVAVENGEKGWAGLRRSDLPAQSAADGSFELHDLPGNVDLRVFAEGSGWEGGTTRVTAGDDEVEIQLGSAQTISGTIVGVDGGPISGARIWVRLAPDPGDASEDSAKRDLLRPAPGQSDAGGRFELRSLSCRAMKLRVTADGFVPRELDLPLASCGGETRVEVRLQPAVIWTGTARTAAGSLLSGATLILDSGLATQTDGSGRFRFDLPGGGPIRGRVRPLSEKESEFAVMVPDVAEAVVDIVVP